MKKSLIAATLATTLFAGMSAAIAAPATPAAPANTTKTTTTTTVKTSAAPAVPAHKTTTGVQQPVASHKVTHKKVSTHAHHYAKGHTK